MEAARSFETLVDFYQSVLCHIPEEGALHIHCRDNLRFRTGLLIRVGKRELDSDIRKTARRGLRGMADKSLAL
jgi:hypothetical protein